MQIREELLDVSSSPDYKEVLDLGPEEDAVAAAAVPFHGPNRWPSALSDAQFKNPLLAHQAKLLEVARDLVHAFALALGVEECYFDQFIQDPILIHRLNHYPQREHQQSQEDHRELSCGAHTDYGLLSLSFNFALSLSFSRFL